MKAESLTLDKAATLLKTDLIKNGKGTQALHDTVVAYRANRRQGTRGTKTKATVQKSGKKPWRQKGTGRARAGYVASPIWRGGGVVFGPQPHDFSKKIPVKVKRLALRKAISERAKSGDLLLIDAIKLATPSTKTLVKLLQDAGVAGSALLVLEQHDETVYLSARNHLALDTTTADKVNAEDFLRHDKVVVTPQALNKIADRLKD
jgi:large subunit ribosomal protein L4